MQPGAFIRQGCDLWIQALDDGREAIEERPDVSDSGIWLLPGFAAAINASDPQVGLLSNPNVLVPLGTGFLDSS